MQPMHPVESRQTLPKFEYYAHAQGWISRKGRGGEHNNADVSVGIEEIEIDVADPMYNVESYYYAKKYSHFDYVHLWFWYYWICNWKNMEK